MDPKSKTLKPPIETPKAHETQETPLSPSHFSCTITKVAVSQICESIGFKGSKTSALETLTSIGTIYLQTLAKFAASFATSSGRTESNLFDLIYAIEDMAYVQGFPGASNVHKSLLRSTTLIDIMNFVESTDEIPFAKPIPHNNASKKSKSSKNYGVFARDFEQESRWRSHIPPWLPAFPDPSTYEIRNEISFVKSICDGNSSKNLVSPGNSETFVRDFELSSRHSDIQHDSSTNEIARITDCKEEERRRFDFELPAERARVRFKMGVGREVLGVGVDLRNGVCRGGKRVCWSNRMDEGGEKKKSSFKKR